MCVRVRTLSYKYTVVHARPLRLSARSSTGAGGMATVIKDNNNSVVDTYISGGAVDHEHFYLPCGVYNCDGALHRPSSGVSGSDSERASDASEVSELFMLSLQRLLNVAAGAVTTNNHFVWCYS